MDDPKLVQQQRESLWLDGHRGLYTVADALSFMREVCLALRYRAASNLPIASMYRATQRQVPVPEDEKTAHARAFELTNGMLATGTVVEINLIADRLCLVHERIVAPIYALRRGRGEPSLSDAARQAFDFIVANENATSGDIRRLLRSEAQKRPDSADLALAELQRELLVDRGPSAGPTMGVFYLTREGYPYRVFATSHSAVVRSASCLGQEEAAAQLLTNYLSAARFATRRNLARLFQLVVSVEEIDHTIQILIDSDHAHLSRLGKNEVIVYDAG